MSFAGSRCGSSSHAGDPSVKAAQAYDLLTEAKKIAWGKGTQEAYRVIREHVTYLEKDRELGSDIENMVALIRTGKIIHAVENAVGELSLE